MRTFDAPFFLPVRISLFFLIVFGTFSTLQSIDQKSLPIGPSQRNDYENNSWVEIKGGGAKVTASWMHLLLATLSIGFSLELLFSCSLLHWQATYKRSYGRIPWLKTIALMVSWNQTSTQECILSFFPATCCDGYVFALNCDEGCGGQLTVTKRKSEWCPPSHKQQLLFTSSPRLSPSVCRLQDY
ncbi:uncharacterized protein LOC111793219 isoform X2 [Cucurbita pepo subsp. pepo]|uniref:uncharacterized protein LOC111793219 isoform X2 n=1 Tax=Cucurbita pepo subsp. pepo TaxID=3664 RepID=UPI000C9D6DC8|nr:uncharacterized protein LOC111793219 isoform X2 [Cucurbita pepo subsp. pepo]